MNFLYVVQLQSASNDRLRLRHTQLATMSTALTIQLSPDLTYSCSLEIERPASDGEGTVWQSAPIVTKGLERGESPDRHAHGWVCAEAGRVSDSAGTCRSSKLTSTASGIVSGSLRP